MHFETTRRRFIALLSSMIAFPQTKAGALPKSATPTRLKSAAPDVLLFFTQPAPEWAAALPVGNGRIGAMVFGGVNQERIAPNEDILWSCGPVVRPIGTTRMRKATCRSSGSSCCSKRTTRERTRNAATCRCWRYKQGPIRFAFPVAIN
jgi:Glycosyl hydrolase family 65, N-terminal domain